MGESVVEASIGRWLKQEGEPVSVGEALVELETDKVNTELPADDSGVLSRILRREGETVKPGDTVAEIEPGAAALKDSPSPTQPASGPRDAPPPAPAPP